MLDGNLRGSGPCRGATATAYALNSVGDSLAAHPRPATTHIHLDWRPSPTRPRPSRRTGREIAVAHVKVTSTRPVQGGVVRAHLCRLLLLGGSSNNNNYDDSSWQTVHDVPIHHANDTLYWHTDTVVSFGGDTLCWVDYFRSLLFCDDVLSPNPELRYVRLPVDPYNEKRDHGRSTSYQSLCVTNNGHALKFVDTSTWVFWFVGKPPKRLGISSYSAANAWTLSGARLAWVKDGEVDEDELLDLTESLNVPRTQLEFTLVDVSDAETIYLVLGDAPFYRDAEKNFVVAVNMANKTLDACVLGSGRDTAACDRPYSCNNIFVAEPFLACEFPKYQQQGLDDDKTQCIDDTR